MELDNVEIFAIVVATAIVSMFLLASIAYPKVKTNDVFDGICRSQFGENAKYDYFIWNKEGRGGSGIVCDKPAEIEKRYAILG